MGSENWRVVDSEIDKGRGLLKFGGINSARDFWGIHCKFVCF